MEGWTTIYETSQPVEAEIIKGLLENNGLEVVILNQQDSLYKFGVIKVMVNEQNKAKALDIIKDTHGQ